MELQLSTWNCNHQQGTAITNMELQIPTWNCNYQHGTANTNSSMLVVASSSPHMDKGSNCSDSDNAEHPSKKDCGELNQPLTTKKKYSKNWENEFSWLVNNEYINGALCRV